jgi:osmoprotectant transport system ATP-binding protein
MDEAFSAVDPLGRTRLQSEFLQIQRQVKKTVVFVTHDVDEAVRLGDNLVLLRDGQVVQHGSTDDLLERPAEEFVAHFLGRDRALKRLSRIPAFRAARPLPLGRSGISVPETSDLRTVLSSLLESGDEVVVLTNEWEEPTGWLHRSDVERWARVEEVP